MAGDGAFGHRVGAEPGAIDFLVEGLPKVPWFDQSFVRGLFHWSCLKAQLLGVPQWGRCMLSTRHGR